LNNYGIHIVRDREIWESFVSSHHRAHFLQSFYWGQTLRSIGWNPIRIALKKDNAICGTMQIMSKKFLGKSIWVSPFGPMIAKEDRELYDEMIDASLKLAREYKVLFFKTDFDTLVDDRDRIEFIKSKKFLCIAKGQIYLLGRPKNIFRVDISPDPETIFSSFTKTLKSNIHIAQKNKIQIKQGFRDGLDIDQFYRMYLHTAARKKFPSRRLKYFKAIKECMIDNGYGEIFWAVYENIPVALALIFKYGKTIWYMYGATDGKYKRTCAAHLLQWKIILWAKDQGATLYDLRGIPPNPEPGTAGYGVYFFKKQFNPVVYRYTSDWWYPVSSLGLSLWFRGVNDIDKIRRLYTSKLIPFLSRLR
jgi:peptidoglycan pentaglycine glycine transferase (the first glycine)